LKSPTLKIAFRVFAAAVLLVGIGCVQNVFAHAPFDCSSRVIVHADSAEITVTVGTSLGENYLRAAQLDPRRLSNGHPFALKPELATNFFVMAVDGKVSSAREADVISDGLEFQFHFEYALTPAKVLRLQSQFLPALPPPHTVALVMTDENGNILGSDILTPGRDTANLALPEKLFPQAAVTMVVPISETNLSVAKAVSSATETRTQPGFGEFLRLGIGHILNVSAFDHLLFLTALLLGCRNLKTMLLVITGFTLAHSLTLALAALNIVTISSRIVEPAIAASIIFVAAENFRRTEKSWPRYALTCGFGLIHGFGFAGALRASGLGGTGAEIAMPLFAFNLGVEIGQLTVAAVLLPLLFGLHKWPWFERNGARIISALVILVAAFWLWQRIVSSGD
jgi:hypothetical protein